MKILLTGATGYIAQRLLPVLLAHGHEVICLVRDESRFDAGKFESIGSTQLLEADILDLASLEAIPKDIDAAYTLCTP